MTEASVLAFEPLPGCRRKSLPVTPYANVSVVREVLDGATWRSLSIDPQFLLAGDLPGTGTGYYLFEAEVLPVEGCSGAPVLYFDFGNDFDGHNAVTLGRWPLSRSPYAVVVHLAAAPKRIRFDPCEAPGEFFCSEVGVTALRIGSGGHLPVVDGAALASFPHVEGQPGLSAALPAAESPRRTLSVGVVLHLYYEDLWPEMSGYLGHIPLLERLYVSIPEHASVEVEKRIRKDYPFALVRRVPNRGRDMLPFLQWFEVAARQGVDLLCKIHTKRSPQAPAGEAWRRDVLDKLLGARTTVEGILASFTAEPALGIVAPGGHVVPSTSFYWERNATRVADLCRRMGRTIGREPFDYIAGTMFWARVDALLPLRRLALRDGDFESEQGLDDGTLVQAAERCFTVAASVAGFTTAETANPTGATVHDFAPPPPLTYGRWIWDFEPRRGEYGRIAQSEAGWADPPLISVLMPVYNTEASVLDAAIASVRTQVYPHWELCVADDASTSPAVREVLERHRQADSRIKAVYRAENGHISAASNSALELATGRFVALLDHDDELHPLALHYVAEAIIAHPDCELVYTDEDKLGPGGQRQDPYFKCELNYELLLAHNMVSHLGCYRTGRMREIGGFRVGYEGSQDYDLVLRFLEGLDPGKVVHVPRPLYHWRMVEGSTSASTEEKPYAQTAARRAIAEHLERVGLKGEVLSAPEAPAMNRIRFAVPEPPPSVAIVIPTRDRADLLGMCLDSLHGRTTYPNFAIVVVDNGSVEPETLALLDRAREMGVTVLRDDSEFNFSALNNRAVRTVATDFVCLLNNDIEILTPDWLEEMVGMACRPGVGAVGARLWYPDMTIQHAGVIGGLGGVAGHPFKGHAKGDPGYFGRAVLHQELSAVTAACLLVRRAIYEQVGGLDETLQVAFNDIDFCLRLREAGYRNVWTPYAEMIHHESATRGYETTPEKHARFVREIAFMHERWGGVLDADPAYSPNLDLSIDGFKLAWPPRGPMQPAAQSRV